MFIYDTLLLHFNCRVPPSSKLNRPSHTELVCVLTKTCSQFCMRKTSACSSTSSSIEDIKSKSLFFSPSAPTTVRRPSGDAIMMSDE